MKNWEGKHWGSLAQLRDFLQNNTKIKVISFNGIYLETSVGTYALGPEGLKKLDKSKSK